MFDTIILKVSSHGVVVTALALHGGDPRIRIATGASMVGKHWILGLLRYWKNPTMLQ
jgi:hypothetical protein